MTPRAAAAGEGQTKDRAGFALPPPASALVPRRHTRVGRAASRGVFCTSTNDRPRVYGSNGTSRTFIMCNTSRHATPAEVGNDVGTYPRGRFFPGGRVSLVEGGAGKTIFGQPRPTTRDYDIVRSTTTVRKITRYSRYELFFIRMVHVYEYISYFIPRRRVSHICRRRP